MIVAAERARSPIEIVKNLGMGFYSNGANWGQVPILLFGELDFIINYALKYRMGLGGEETAEEDN